MSKSKRKPKRISQPLIDFVLKLNQKELKAIKISLRAENSSTTAELKGQLLDFLAPSAPIWKKVDPTDQNELTKQFSRHLRDKAENNEQRKNFIHNIHQWSSELRRDLLHFFADKHEGRPPQMLLLDMLRHIHILRNRGLYDQALDEIAKAEKLTESNELLHSLMEVQFLKHLILLNNFSAESDKRSEHNRMELRKTQRKIRNTLELGDLFEDYCLVNYSKEKLEYPLLQQKLERIIPHEEHETYKELPLDGLIAYHTVQSYIAEFQNDRERRKDQLKKLIDIIRKAPHLSVPHYQSRYIKLLTHYFNACYYDKDIPEIEWIVEEIRNIEAQTPLISIERKDRLLYTEHILLIEKRDFEALMILEPKIKSFIENHQPYQLRYDRYLAFATNLAMASLSVEETDRALYWIERLEARRVANFRKDIFIIGKLARVIWYFELSKGQPSPALDNESQKLTRYKRDQMRNTELSENLKNLLDLSVKFASTLRRATGAGEKHRPAMLKPVYQQMKPTVYMDEICFWLENRFGLP